MTTAETVPDESIQRRKRSLFLWGVSMVWLLSIPTVLGLLNAFRGISEQKATGLGVLASGIVQGCLTIIVYMAAIVLLARSFAKGHRARTFVAALSIAWGMLVVLAISLPLAIFYFYRNPPMH